MLVQAGTTAYTLDLAAPLSQGLHDGSASYLYGNGAERLRAAGGAWSIPDALGSVRATLDGAGTLLASTSYDPWGLPLQGRTEHEFYAYAMPHNADVHSAPLAR